MSHTSVSGLEARDSQAARVAGDVKSSAESMWSALSALACRFRIARTSGRRSPVTRATDSPRGVQLDQVISEAFVQLDDAPGRLIREHNGAGML
jgi:hypothetical protein